MTKPAKPLAGYIRVSRKGDRDDETFRSPEQQRDAIARYAAGEGLEVELLEPEIDVSGSNPRRLVLDRALARVRSGELGGLVVARLDRLSRLKPRDRVLLFEEIESAGGVVLSASEQLDPSTPEGRFARDVFLGIARMQWEKYRDGFEQSKAGAIAAGIPVHTRPPVGYRARPDRRLEPDPHTAPLVRELFERRARGEGPSALADFLRDRGVRTSQGSPSWSKQAIAGLLTNRVYLGELSYGKDSRYLNAAAHEPIVDLALFQAAQHPNGHRLAPLRKAESSWVLAGLLRCASCRHAMQGTTTGRGKRIYRCIRRHAGGVCPAPARVDADLVERQVVTKFWARTEELKAESANGAAAAELAEAAGRAEAEAERAQQLLEQWLSPAMQAAIGDASEYAAGTAARRSTRDEAAAALGHARDELRALEHVGDAELVVTLRDRSDQFTTADWRQALARRFDCVTLDTGRRLVFYFTGLGPADLPRRGFRRRPGLVAFPEPPAAAGVVALEPA